MGFTVLHCTLQNLILLYTTAEHYAALKYTILHCIELYCTALQFSVLYGT